VSFDTAKLKDLVSTVRDLLLLALFVLLLINPKFINDRLVAAGFTKGSIAGFEWEKQLQTSTEQTKAAGETVQKADENYSDLVARLNDLEHRVTDPAVKTEVKNLGQVAEKSRLEIQAADTTLKHSLAAQQQIFASIAPSSVADTGWIFAGKLNEEKTAWDPTDPPTVSPSPLSFSPGMKLTVRDDVYLRADATTNAHASASILGVAHVGEQLEVLAQDPSHFKRGGWFIWLKVRRL
jgi:hypothetical protein